MSNLLHRAALAERAARAGGVVARKMFRETLAVDTKANKNDVVTETDRDAQAQVVATVREEFSDDPFLCEEELVSRSGPESVESEPTAVDAVPETGTAWVVDPIDGTANFVRGLRTWTTSVAAIADGEAVGAATYMPSMGDLYASGPDSATRDGTTLSVSDRTDPETFVAAPVGRFDRGSGDDLGAVSAAIVDRLADVRRIGSMQATLAAVASGELDATFSTYSPYPWDSLAGIHLVRQAGGTVTGLDGEPWTFESDAVVASNGAAHEAVCEVARAAESG